jgi:precorrin-6y C5,15-methyltransferase (decarboxylating) CbiE subunit
MEKGWPRKLKIVGCGPGSPDYLTVAGRQAIDDATLLVGSPRLLDLYGSASRKHIRVGADIEAVLDEVGVARGDENVVVLVSGDPGLCSLAVPVLRRFGRDACDVIPGISSVQLAFARLGLDWLDARIISAHKDIPDLAPEDMSASGNIAILAGHGRSQSWIGDLAEAFEHERSIVVCENLSIKDERVRRVSAAEFRGLELSTRTIVLFLKEDLP